MKFNKWTLGLATVGAVSLASAARADEKMNSLQTALSNTTISGYVSASANWEITPNSSGYRSGTLTSPASYIPFQGPTKTDGFNLDVVKLTIAKPEDESPWASGYEVDLLFGPDASGIGNASPGVISGAPGNTASEVAIKNAFVTLRTPVGNGIDWKIGVFDTVIGYEASDSGSNPNYTRSYGWAIEPTEHTGILATYKINDEFTVSAGVANTLAPGINARAFDNTGNKDGNKTLMGSVTFTAPTNWGWAAGSSIYGGIVYGFNGTGLPVPHNNGFYANGNQVNYYAGVTLNTPWKQLTAGLAFDYVHNLNGGGENNVVAGVYGYHNSFTADVWSLGLYGTYKVTDKLSLNLRGEYVGITGTDNYSYSYAGVNTVSTTINRNNSIYELTATVEYDLWANVMTRLEARWDGADNKNTFVGSSVGTLNRNSSFGLYANVIYKF